jgi:hypothetical protein
MRSSCGFVLVVIENHCNLGTSGSSVSSPPHVKFEPNCSQIAVKLGKVEVTDTELKWINESEVKATVELRHAIFLRPGLQHNEFFGFGFSFVKLFSKNLQPKKISTKASWSYLRAIFLVKGHS